VETKTATLVACKDFVLIPMSSFFEECEEPIFFSQTLQEFDGLDGSRVLITLFNCDSTKEIHKVIEREIEFIQGFLDRKDIKKCLDSIKRNTERVEYLKEVYSQLDRDEPYDTASQERLERFSNILDSFRCGRVDLDDFNMIFLRKRIELS
jgi:hypothetical protein